MTAAAMPVPAVDVVAARRDAQRVGQAAGLAARAADRVGASQPASWFGGAASAADAARAELARCVDDVARLAPVVAGAVGVYADRVVPALARMRAAAEDLQVALAVQASDDASPRGAQLVAAAWADYEAGQVAYRAAVTDCERALAAVPAQSGPLVRGPGRHVPDGLGALWAAAVADPAAGAWALTGAYVTDRQAWRSAVSGLLPGLVEQVRHPVRTVDELLGGPAWRAGEWGVAAGTAAGALIGFGKLKPLTAAEKRRYAPNMADPDAPRPRRQALDELFDAVDLPSQEHYAMGHTLRRHVDVDDGYLEDRLRQGTVLDSAVWGRRPPGGLASSWRDVETAETWTTRVLRHHERSVRSWAYGSDTGPLRLSLPADSSVGEVMEIVDDRPRKRPANTVRVVLAKDEQGVFVLTAFPDIDPRGGPGT
ncbi:MAG: RNase A-like domain-containing protein [Actinomycetota bacterium]